MNQTGRARGNRPRQSGDAAPPQWRRRLTRPPALVALAVLIVAVVAFAATRPLGPKELSLSEFRDAVASGRVDSAKVADDAGRINGELDDGTRFVTAFPAEYADEATTLLLDAKVDTKVEPDAASLIEKIVFNLLPTFMIVGVFLWFMLKMQPGSRSMKFGRAKTKQRSDGAGVTFADVAGAEEAVTELAEVTDFLRDPDRFQRLGARIPRGVLLAGPPGTGKTLLARAVAGEADVPFFTISGSDFVEMFVGVGASRVRDLFKQAKEQAPAIIFVDEIDAVGRRRGAGSGGGHDEREQTLNQMLVEMDGFEPASGVILMAATNRPDILDPALLRPGRFDRQVFVDTPDVVGRTAILEVHARNKPLADDVDLSVLARSTPGFTGADLANVINEGALLAARRGHERIAGAELQEAVDRVLAGPERRSKVMNDREKHVVAVHESGHALVGHALPNADPVHKVSIVARGQALGITMSLPEEDRNLHTRSWIEDHLAVLLAGRTAEEVVLGEITTGAADDIERATRLARDMVTRFGMSEKLGPLRFGVDTGERFMGGGSHRADYSDDVASRIDTEIARLIEDAHLRARMLIERHRPALDALTDRLIEVETVNADELGRLLAGVGGDGAPGTIGGNE